MPFPRCMFYDESGEPVRGGCHKKASGTCQFTHPDHPDWSRARPSRAREKSGSDSRSFRSWGDRQDYTAPAGPATTSTSVSTSGADAAGGWGPGGEWGDGSNWGDDSGWGDGSGWGGGGGGGTTGGWGSPTPVPMSYSSQPDATSSACGNGKGSWRNIADSSKDVTTSWKTPETRTTDKQPEEPERNKGKGRAIPAPPRIRIPNKSKNANDESLGSRKWGEPQPRSPNILVSTPLSSSTLAVAATPTLEPFRAKRKRDGAPDDKRDVFKEYVKAWERGVRTQCLLAEAEAKCDRWFRTQKSACYARIGEAGRKKLDDQRASYDKEVNMHKEKLSTAISSLVEFHDTFVSKLDLGQRYNIGEEANTFIAESKAFVEEIRALVANVLKDKDNASMQKPSESSEIDPSFIDSLRNKVRDLEERFEQAQTELTLRRRPDIRPMIEELLTDKIAALRAERTREIERVVSRSPTEIAIAPDTVTNMETMAQRAREVDAKVPHTVEDIRVLLLRVEATTQRVKDLEQELSKNRTAYTEQMQKIATEKEETRQRLDKRLADMEDQLQLVATQAAQPDMPLTLFNSRNKLMESLQPEFEAVLNTFYERDVQPTIDTLQQVVMEASRRQQEASFRELWSKIQPAMNMVSGVCRWLDSQDLRLTAPVPAE